MSFELVKITVTSRRHVPTSFGNKDSFYSESIEIPTNDPTDRSSVYAFLCQRMDLSFLLDYYYSCPDSKGNLPNSEVWPHVISRIESMKVIHGAFPTAIKGFLSFNPATYLGS